MTPERLREILSWCEGAQFAILQEFGVSGDPPDLEFAAVIADLTALLGELEGRAQPTREELADAIEDDVQAAVFTAKGVREAALDAIDVLVARGWVGVSDTPNEAQ